MQSKAENNNLAMHREHEEPT